MKEQAKESVVHDWLSDLPFTQQAVLLLSLRGADGTDKWTAAKAITFYVRGVILKPAYPGTLHDYYPNPDNFMRADFETFIWEMNQFFFHVDMMPHHYIMHLIHCAEIIGYAHPNYVIATFFEMFYRKSCKALHMNPETKHQLFKRLSK